MNQAEFMRRFNEEHREQFEPYLFERSNEEMVEAIRQIITSCQRDKYFTIKILSFRAIYDYEEIHNTLREHEEKRKKKNSKVENIYDYININDTDMILIKVEWLCRHNGSERQEIDKKTVIVTNPEEVVEVLIALPRFVRKYYFRLSGNYYTTTFQIVDGSTYNNSTASQSKVDSITMKTMMQPMKLFRGFKDLVDVNTKETVRLIEYTSMIFSNSVNAIYYLLANFGLYGTSYYLGIDCVFLDTKPNLDPNFYCFQKNGIYISCPKIMMQDSVVQSYVATIYSGITKDVTSVNDLFDIRYWLSNLGKAFKNQNIDKGLFVLDSIDGIYDNITKRDLHLSDENKEDVYSILRWLIREFVALRIKENVDVRTKRVRIADYIAQVYSTKLNKGIHRISDLGSKVTLKKVIQAIYTQPMFIINSISGMSNLVAYRDLVNDGDATTALKYTYKGISGLGEDGSSVQPIYRYVDPSHVGILDLDASSSSDPGMSGMICPMTKIYNHSFSEYKEPDSWKEEYAKLEAEYKYGKAVPVSFDHEQPNPYLGLREKIVQEELEINKIICPLQNIHDPNVVYTNSALVVENNKNAQPKSLFTIIPNEE